MKRFIGLAVCFALLSFVGSAYGAVAVDDINGYVGEVSNIYIKGQDVTSDGSRATILANGHKEGVTTNSSSESNLVAAALAYGVINRTGLDYTNAYSTTIANGTAGQMVTIILTAVTSGTWVITDDGVSAATATALVNTGWDDITFNAALDSVTLLYVSDVIGWVIIGQNSVTVT